MNDELKQKIKDLPDSPGVYIMKDDKGNILYIGKARVLKNRVRQYFNSPKNKTTKVLIMVSKIYTFDYIITRNEVEALVLENNLIKEHKPPYNILLKDDKNYPFVRINLKEDFPRVEVVRKLKKDGAKYFGPYMQGITSKDILELINSAFKLRSCTLNFKKIPSSHRACLNYHIGRCSAPCIGAVSKEEYHLVLQDVIEFLRGNDKSVKRILESRMSDASKNQDYELAIYYRDKLKILDKLVRKQVTALANDSDMDIFAVTGNGANTVVATLFVRGGKLLGGDKQLINDASLSPEIALSGFISGYYNSAPIMPEIIVNIAIDGKEALEDYLSETSGSKVNIVEPIQGVRRQLVDMAENNANDYLEKCVGMDERKYNMTLGSLTQLKEALGLDFVPYRMECYDVSHISGTNKVASMVVFTNGERDSKMYRKFKIKTVEGNNDFASMYEVLDRRLTELEKGDDISFAKRPDLIVIDGGAIQLEYVMRAVKMHNSDVTVISLAKREEEVYLPYRADPIVIDKRSYALMLLQRIRDEAHRFAVTFHKSLRGKKQIESELSAINGIGKAKIRALFQHFKTIDAMKKASIDSLKEVKGITQNNAEDIFEYFAEKN